MADEVRLYELINPSDPITFRATPLHAAFIADRMRAGMYFVTDVQNGKSPAEPDDMQEAYNRLWQDEESIRLYSEAYGSFLVGTPRDRVLFDEIVSGMTSAERKARRDKWHDERRSSMNDICRQCWEIAEKIASYAPEATGHG